MARIQVPAGAFKEYAEGDKLISQGWHTFRVSKVEGPELSKKGDSHNFWLHVDCLTPEFAKRKIQRTCFNEKSFEPDKAKYQVIPFILALDPSLTMADLVSSGITIEWNDVVNKTFDGRIRHKEYNGRISEELADYAPAGTRVGKAE